MAKILYGVSGEGSGHSSRARLIASALIAQGHLVKMASYDRGYRNLKDDFDVLEIIGLSIVSEDNEVSKLKTITANLAKIPSGTRALNVLRDTFKQFQPDLVITDFEPCSAYLAAHYGVPLVSLDNQHRIRYMEYTVPANMSKDAFVTETVIRAMVPKPWVSLITTFHQGPLKNTHSFLFPPILRESVLQLSVEDKGHVLVYVTSGFDSLLTVLRQFPRERFLVYGYDKVSEEDNLVFRPFSADAFLQDLAAAKAVVATAGFTLISEALHLGKPYLALPMQGQFEQQLNAHMLAQQGYGAQCDAPNATAIAAFLYRLPEYRQALLTYPRQGNGGILQKLNDLLANHGQLLKDYQR